MKYIQSFKIFENTEYKGDLNKVFSNSKYEINQLWREVENNDQYPVEVEDLRRFLKYNNINLKRLFKDSTLKKNMYNVSLRHDSLETYVPDLIHFFKRILKKGYNLHIEDFNGKNKIFDNGTYQVFLIQSFDEIQGFDKNSAICGAKVLFKNYNQRDKIHFVFKDGIYKCSFSVDRKTHKITVISLTGNKVVELEYIKENDPYLYKLMKAIEKSSNTFKYMKEINESKSIKEFWEFSKNLYGHNKYVNQSKDTLTTYNQSNGYGSEGQWVLTTDHKKVYIEKMENGRYIGFDTNGDQVSGSINDIVRSLMKDEVVKESKNMKKRYGVVMMDFDPNSDVFKKAQNIIKDEDIFYNERGKYPPGGRVKDPHVTVLFGLHSDIEDEDVENTIKTFKCPSVKLENISVFENDDYDVVKFDIDNTDLKKMNQQLKSLPYTSDYDQYHPHVTIAYVKPGEGKKYVQKLSNPIIMEPYRIVYSKADRTKKYYEFSDSNQSGEIRVSCAGLASIKIDDKYLLVENKKSRSKGSIVYGPLGGALEYLPNGKKFLDTLNPEYERQTPDLRMIIDYKDIEKFTKWFKSTDDREKSTKREVYEELVLEEKVINDLKESDISEKYIKSVRDKRERFGVMVERFFEIFEIKFPKDIENELKEISLQENSTVKLFTKEEILNNKNIGYHSRFVL